MSRTAARTDGNQGDIVDALRRIGCSVSSTAGLGKGFPDLVVGKAGVNLLVEIKDNSQPKSKQKLTKDQKEFFATWRGQASVVNSVESALELVSRRIPNGV